MPYKNDYPCSIDDCDKPRRNKGMCAMHAKRVRLHSDPLKVLPRGNFAKHPTCTIEGCNTKHTAFGLCQMHYKDFITFCDRSKGIDRRRKFAKTKNKRYVDVYVPSHPNASRQGIVKEHRLVMEQMIGRYLLAHENVHHKNGVRDDNRPENLELWSKAQPAGQRIEDKVKYAIEILALYAPERLVP